MSVAMQGTDEAYTCKRLSRVSENERRSCVVILLKSASKALSNRWRSAGPSLAVYVGNRLSSSCILHNLLCRCDSLPLLLTDAMIGTSCTSRR